MTCRSKHVTFQHGHSRLFKLPHPTNSNYKPMTQIHGKDLADKINNRLNWHCTFKRRDFWNKSTTVFL